MQRKPVLEKKDTIDPSDVCLPDTEVPVADAAVDVLQLVPDTS